MNQPLAYAPLLETPQGSIPLRYSIEQVPEDSDGQVAATISKMSRYVCEDCQSGPVVYDARCAIASNPNDPLTAVHQFVRSRLKFRNDEAITQPYTWMLPKGNGEDYFVECLKRPVDVSLEYAYTGQPVEEDCDGHAMYCAALLKALGVDCSFCTVAANEKKPNIYSHVYVVAYWRGKRYAMDCSHGPYAGWEHSPYYRLQEWPIFDRQSYGLVGLALVAAGWFAWRNRNEIRRLFA